MTKKYELKVQGDGRPIKGFIQTGDFIIIGQIAKVQPSEKPLPLRDISPRHARLECTDTGCQITDLGSRQGTSIDGVPLTPGEPTPVSPGQQVQLGPYILTIQAVDDPPKEKASLPDDDDEAAVESIAVETSELSSAGHFGSDQESSAVPTESPETTAPDHDESDAQLFEPDGNGSGQYGGGGSGVVSSNGTGPQELDNWDSVPPDLFGLRLLSYLPEPYHPPKFNGRKSRYDPEYFLARFLGIFEAILSPVEKNIDNFDIFLNPIAAPSDFLPWLKTWFELAFEPGWTDAQRRQFLQRASRLYARRGTRRALSEALEIYVGAEPRIDDSDNQPPHTFLVTLRLPPGQTIETVNRRVVERIIQHFKPAHTRYKLRW